MNPFLIPLTDPYQIQQYVNIILHGVPFRVTSKSATPEYNVSKKDFENTDMYVTPKQGDYHFFIIKMKKPTNWIKIRNHQYAQAIRKETNRLAFPKEHEKPFDNSYSERNYYMTKLSDPTKLMQNAILKKYPDFFDYRILIIINDKDIEETKKKTPTIQDDLFGHNQKKAPSSYLPIRIASAIYDDYEGPSDSTIEVNPKDFNQIIAKLPGCEEHVNDAKNLPRSNQDISNVWMLSHSRYQYELHNEQSKFYFIHRVISSLIIDHQINNMADFENLAINPFGKIEDIANYQNLKEYNPELFNRQAKNIQTDLPKFKQPVIKEYPQNFETLLKQTDPKEYSLYYHQGHYYRINRKGVSQIKGGD